MKNKSAWVLGSLALAVGCTLHDTSYLEAGDPDARGGAAGEDSGGNGAVGANAGTSGAIGGAGESGSPEGGAGAGGDSGYGGGVDGGDGAMAGGPAGGSDVGGGAGASGCGDARVECASDDVITDFESNDGHLCVENSGTVIAYGDGTGTQSPEIGDVKAYDASTDCDRGSLYALHALGAGAKDYGFGVALRLPQNVDAVAAEYKGIRFKAKAAKAKRISIKVAIPATLDASFGGSCEPVAGPPMKLCNDHPAASVAVAAGGWLDYQVAFSSLKQEGWGVVATPSFEAVAQVHFVFPGPVSGGSAEFDVWLDDVEFYK
jgi:hypothetical protein